MSSENSEKREIHDEWSGRAPKPPAVKLRSPYSAATRALLIPRFLSRFWTLSLPPR